MLAFVMYIISFYHVIASKRFVYVSWTWAYISFRECVQTYGTNNMEICFTLVSGLSACRPRFNF